LTKFELHIPIIDDSEKIIEALSKQPLITTFNLSNSLLKQAITKGALWLTRGKYTQRLRRIKKKLQQGDELHFYYNQAILAQQPTPATLIADFNDYSVWNKPYGMLAQGSKWSDHCSISRWAQTQLTPERPVFIVHRLDRAATGLIMLAHSKNAARALTAMFENRTCEKRYEIIVHGNHNERPQPDVITKEIETKKSCSTFLCKAYSAEHNISLIGVKIESGRKHQIRLHAASINMPVVGDRLHGLGDIVYPDALNLQLCAVSLRFTCPLTEQERNFTLADEDKPSLSLVSNLLSE
jgi:tRNA pseudouridine32 synthase/23S rRNA pseudouridine746 synthase